MPGLYYLNVTVHISAMLWLGGMFFHARINAILGVLLVVAAVRSARGG